MKKILIADNDKNIRSLLEAELTLEGYEVILADSVRNKDIKDLLTKGQERRE